MSPPHQGSCLCGQVEFQIHADPIIVSCCHCQNCKKYTGTVFTTNVVFPANSQKVIKGEDLISVYIDSAQDSGNALSRHFCSKCGSSLYVTDGDFGRSMAVFYSALDSPEFQHEAPKVEYYSKDRTLWVPELQGTDKPKTKPGRD